MRPPSGDRYIGLMTLGGFFALKVLLALVMLKLSAQMLTVTGFTVFSQLLMFSALLNTVASGGMQNGLVREIAAAGHEQDAMATFAAARRIWLLVCLGGVGLAVASAPLAELLVADSAYAWTIPVIIVAAALTGLGQLYTAALVAHHRLAANAVAQAAGLIAGTALAVPLLAAHQPALAVIAFAAGNCLTVIVARIFLRGSTILRHESSGPLRPRVRRLLGYSGSFIFAAVAMPTVLFAVRYVYRETFGVEALSEWLVANRVSDVSTQLLGLFMAQWYLPHLARTPDQALAARISLRAVSLAGATMLSFLVIFLCGSSFIIPFVLSEQFLGARDHIAIYMAGDVIRVIASAALFAALARGRLWTYMALEGLSAALFGVLALGMITLSIREAPIFAYPIAYSILAILVAGSFWIRLARDRGR